MFFEEFCEKVKGSMQQYLGTNSKVTIEKITKNNGLKLTGLIAQTEENQAVPTVYLEEYFERYTAGCHYADVMRSIIDFYEQYAGMHMEMDYFCSYKEMKERIVCKLIHYERNKELLAEVPYVPWEDLAIVFFHMVLSDAVGNATVLIRNEHMKMWDITPEQLYKDAMENTPRLMEDELIPLQELLAQMAPDELQQELLQEHVSMYVLTNKWKQFGAISMLYSEKVGQLSDRMQCNLFIIPSSVHEVILMPDHMPENSSKERAIDASFMRHLVKEVNDTQLAQEEVLSDMVYYYDRSTSKIALIS